MKFNCKAMSIFIMLSVTIVPLALISDQTVQVQAQSSQRDRVGVHDNDRQTSGEGAQRGGTVSDPTLCSQTSSSECETTVDANCFGKVSSHEAREHKDSDEGTLGEHTRDPVPELEGNETPRQGIGNQDQGHPAAHGAFNSQFEEEDQQNINENC